MFAKDLKAQFLPEKLKMVRTSGEEKERGNYCLRHE